MELLEMAHRFESVAKRATDSDINLSFFRESRRRWGCMVKADWFFSA